MGFLTMDVLASRLGINIDKLKFKALLGEGRIGGEKVVLVKPQTFMNLSGEALRPIVDFYKLPMENLIVVYDDIDLPLGAVRVRKKGSSGSHNGMKSVIYQLGSEDFPRVRIGLGKSGIVPLMNYVIAKPSKEEQPVLAEAINKAADACECIVREGIEKAMNKANSSSKKD